MRVRSRNLGTKIVTPWSQSQIRYDDGRITTYAQSFSTAQSASLGSEYMEDDITNPGKIVNPCTHNSSENSLDGYQTAWIWVRRDSAGKYDEYRRYFRGFNAITGELLDSYTGSFPSLGSDQIWRNLLDQADAAKCDMQGVVSIAEMAQTVAMFTRPWRALQKLESASGRQLWRRMLGMRSKDALDLAANSWLEYRYGWKPFVSDMRAIVNAQEGIRNAIARENAMNAQVNLFSIREKGPVTITRVPRTSTTTLEVTDVKYEKSYNVHAVVRPPEGYPQTYRHIIAYFGLDQFFENAWEVIPFSFVIDWFVPAGNLLKEMRQDVAGLNDRKRIAIRHSWMTTKSTVEKVRIRRETVGITALEMKVAAYKNTAYSRLPWTLTSGVAPQLAWDSTSPWSLTRSLDGAALTYQRLKR